MKDNFVSSVEKRLLVENQQRQKERETKKLFHHFGFDKSDQYKEIQQTLDRQKVRQDIEEKMKMQSLRQNIHRKKKHFKYAPFVLDSLRKSITSITARRITGMRELKEL